MLTLVERVKLQDAEALNHCKITVGEITTGTMLQSESMKIKNPHCNILLEKEFIALPCRN